MGGTKKILHILIGFSLFLEYPAFKGSPHDELEPPLCPTQAVMGYASDPWIDPPLCAPAEVRSSAGSQRKNEPCGAQRFLRPQLFYRSFMG